MEKLFAVIKNDIVVNVIVSEEKEIAETVTGLTCIEYTKNDNVGLGCFYNSNTNQFTRPELEETTND
jgi:hypothetical protein